MHDNYGFFLFCIGAFVAAKGAFGVATKKMSVIKSRSDPPTIYEGSDAVRQGIVWLICGLMLACFGFFVSKS